MSSDTDRRQREAQAERDLKQAERERARAERERERAERDEQRVRDRLERAQKKMEGAEARIRERSEHAQEKIARALEGVADAEDRAGEMVARAIERAQNAADREGAAVEEVEPLVWFRQEPASRRPAHTRADIARAAMEIADTEGFDAVSMRRVAQRLGAGTMTLYHYVRNKDELVALMTDQVMAEVVIPEDELSEHWRTALTQIANRSRDAFSAHHWIFERFGDGHPGPNGMRHFEQSLRAVAGLELDREQTFEIIGQVDDYVFGYALRELQEQEEHERGWPPEVLDFFQREIDTGNYPLISELFGSDVNAAIADIVDFMSQDGRFERGLDRLLDGIEAEVTPK
ncbi:MAG: TetR/AcrR family transcriptional regulator [Solirubrobacterales bacterium]